MFFLINMINMMFYIAVSNSQGHEVAKEVEGGVQLLNTGSIELIMPETLNFTLKNRHACLGDFLICYAATTLFDNVKKWSYSNIGGSCPPNFCTLGVFTLRNGHYGSGYTLVMKEWGDVIQANFEEDTTFACPRLVVNNRQNFTISELPTCPVIVNGALLPKDKEVESSSNASITWYIVIGVIVGLLLLISVVIGIFMCMRFKKKPVLAVPSIRPDEHISKSPMSSVKKVLPSNSE